ncbi:META domain-containing protein [Cryptosporangium sp. NPDC048952]|uniref:META domain-containing protein n=1 Tax=Cryptosporangium sp. NPDC048952 TaxID=3363961 RepID=UPI0037167AE7
MIRFALVVVTALMLAACGTEESSATTTKEDRIFRSTKVTENGKDRPLVDGTRIHLWFSPDGKHLLVRAGCNRLEAPFTIANGTLELGEVMTTDMGCAQPKMDQDSWLSQFLGTGPTWDKNDDELTLTTDSAEIRLTSTISADEITGVRWNLLGLIQDSGTTGITPGVEAYLEFDGERVTGNAGCNRISGQAVLTANTIEFDQIVSTKMACGGARDAVEKEVLALLNSGTVAMEIEDRLLNLVVGEKGLQFQKA